jgi:transcription elongation GreA/GreB family factor
MNSKERLTRAARGLEVDRVPSIGGWMNGARNLAQIAGITADEYLADPLAGVVKANKALQVDGMVGPVVPQTLDEIRGGAVQESHYEGVEPEALGDIGRPSITIRLLAAANEVALTPTADKDRQHDLLSQVRRTLSARDFAILHDILDHTDAGWAKEIRTAVSRNSGLTDHLRVQILDVLAHSHPVPIGKIAAPWEDEGVVYTTEEALETRRREFDNLLHVKLPQNSTAIGEAAARGDLSENAEFTAALEERDRLTERANAMQADLTRARPITGPMRESETVNVGTAVRARRLSSGEVEEMAFLGPWDADTQKGIYYYRAPMAQAFMGHGAGETVTLRTETAEEQWEILEVKSAI